MPVIINEFEVVPESASAPKAGANQKGGSDETKKKETPDLETVLRRRHERAERVRAH